MEDKGVRDNPGLEARVEITEGICQGLRRNRDEIISHWSRTANSVRPGGFKSGLNLAILFPPRAANHQGETHFEPLPVARIMSITLISYNKDSPLNSNWTITGDLEDASAKRKKGQVSGQYWPRSPK